MNLDVDFENYSVPEERKSQIKAIMDLVRAENWLPDLKTLVHELGVAVEDPDKDSDLFSKLESKLKRFTIDADSVFPANKEFPDRIFHPACGLSIESDGVELKVSFEKVPLLEFAFLPKSNEVAIYYVNEDEFEFLKGKMAELENFLKQAKSSKSARSAEWKARFES